MIEKECESYKKIHESEKTQDEKQKCIANKLSSELKSAKDKIAILEKEMESQIR